LVRHKDEFGPATTDLYRLPRDEFTSARDELAKRLRREDKPAQADEVKALRKPTAAAWLVNQLSHKATGDLKKLLSAGTRMRKARTAVELRKAAAAEREAIGKLLQRAEGIAGEQSAVTIERVRETLHAAAGDVGVGEVVAAGRLEKEQQLVGFGGAALVADDGTSQKTAADTREAAKQRDEDRKRRRERVAAKRKLEQAEQAHERAVAEAQRAQAELKRAEVELREASERDRALTTP
jgi:hypothetical protein